LQYVGHLTQCVINETRYNYCWNR